MLASISDAPVKSQGITKRRRIDSQLKRRRDGESALTRLHRILTTLRLFAHDASMCLEISALIEQLGNVRNVEREKFHVENSESAGEMWILIFPLTLPPSTLINTGAAAHCYVVLPPSFLYCFTGITVHSNKRKFIYKIFIEFERMEKNRMIRKRR